MIRTPDQRLRVFVSSTLVELGAERQAAQRAIERLRLIPVLFDSGARAHAAEDLYRAYLDQSQVFVGIYANSYGWVAPGMDMSGLEEEFHLSTGKPRLIYIKHTSDPRDQRLLDLLATIKKEGSTAYRKFGTAAELEEQLQNDLAILLSERFEDHQRSDANGSSFPSSAPLPVLRGATVGREKEVRELGDLVKRDDIGLVTITGPGGSGKSRLSVLVAHTIRERFKDGVYFVPLASITDPNLVAPAVAGAIGSFDNARRSATDLLKHLLFDKHALLVLDNFEQVIPAATLLTDLLDHCPHLKLLVTSRTPLHLRGEQVYPLAPLAGSVDPGNASASQLLESPAVQLFVTRAKEASPNLDLSESELRAVGDICDHLDGSPLAIELAAARTRMMKPRELQKRLKSVLGLLTRGARDLPERQRTMRATIAWSHDLLDDPTRSLFRRLAVLADRFTLRDAHAVADPLVEELCISDRLETLVDHGLVRHHASHDEHMGALFSLLHVVREFATEQLDASGERERCTQRHAVHFTQRAAELEEGLFMNVPGPWFERAEIARADIRRAFQYWIDTGDRAAAWRLIADQRGYWLRASAVTEALHWCEIAGVYPERDVPDVSETDRGRAKVAAGLPYFVSGLFPVSAQLFEESIALLQAPELRAYRARVECYLGLVRLSMGDARAMTILKEARTEALAVGDDVSACIALNFMSEAHMAKREFGEAEALLVESGAIVAREEVGVGAALYHLQMGALELFRSDASRALEHYVRSIELFERLRMMPLSGWAVWGAAYARFKLGREDESLATLRLCLDRARRTSDRALFAASMLGFAMFALHRGRAADAARLLSAGEALAGSIHYSFWSTDRLLHTELGERVQAAMTQADFDRGTALGATCTQEQAIELVNRLFAEPVGEKQR